MGNGIALWTLLYLFSFNLSICQLFLSTFRFVNFFFQLFNFLFQLFNFFKFLCQLFNYEKRGSCIKVVINVVHSSWKRDIFWAMGMLSENFFLFFLSFSICQLFISTFQLFLSTFQLFLSTLQLFQFFFVNFSTLKRGGTASN